MKINFFAILPAFIIVFFVSACSKSDTVNPPAPVTVEGTWNGTGQYGTAPGGATYAFTVTFKANKTVEITGNNSTAIDNATGTWTLVADSVQATYMYVSSSAVYTLSGKYSSSSNVMAGTIGLGTATTGVGIFSITKQ